MKLRMISRWAVITLVVVVAIIAIIHQVVVTHSGSQPPARPAPTHTRGAIPSLPLDVTSTVTYTIALS